MSSRHQINYFRQAHYMFCEQDGVWHSFGPMPLFKAIILAVGKYRVNHEPMISSTDVSLIGIDAILSVRQRADFPILAADGVVNLREGTGIKETVASR